MICLYIVNFNEINNPTENILNNKLFTFKNKKSTLWQLSVANCRFIKISLSNSYRRRTRSVQIA